MARPVARSSKITPHAPPGEWVSVALRAGVIVLLSALLLTASGRFVTDSPLRFVLIVLVTGAIGLTLHAFTLLVPPLHSVAPWISIAADALLAGGFAYAAGSAVELVFPAWLMIATAGLLRASLSWSAVQVSAVTLAGLAGTYSVLGAQLMSTLARVGVVPVASVLTGIAIIVTALALDRVVGAQRREIIALQREGAAQTSTMRERMRALYELAFSLSDSIRYERILQTALDAGTLGVRRPDRTGPGLVAAVMLYHADDNLLHVVASRRFSKADETQTIPGKEGIIGAALKDVEPVIGTNARKDPELLYFSSFQFCKSILAIPLHSGYDNFGIIVYGSEHENDFSEENRDVLSAIGLLATVGLQNSLLYQTLLEEKERLVEVEEDARKKLARDLHDGPTQSISAIAMRMNYILRLYAKSPEKVPDELRKVEDLARKTTREIRHMLFTLRPLVLETQGLAIALQQLAEKVAETHGQAVQVRVSKDVESVLDRTQQGVIFYIIEEAINNARKHAQASLIQVTVSRQDNVAVIKIADNGRGFDTQSVDANYDQRGSLGMINMRERAELIEGRLNIESVPGRGTVITVVVPLRTSSVLTPEATTRAGTTKIELAAVERLLRRDSR